MGLLENRRGLVFGVANRRSIAWAIAQALAREGAELAFTFQGERIEQGVRDLASSVGTPPGLVLPCDVSSDADLDRVFEAVGAASPGVLTARRSSDLRSCWGHHYSLRRIWGPPSAIGDKR